MSKKTYSAEWFKRKNASDPEWRERRRAQKREWGALRYKARRAWIDNIKLTAGCFDCGYNAHPAALQFDHLDPTKKAFQISISVTRAMPVLQAEIDKCVVRCANCHAIKNTKAEPGKRGGRPRVVEAVGEGHR